MHLSNLEESLPIINSSIVILGIVRDVEKTIELDYARFTKAFSNFSHVSWFLVESDSEDKSTEKLRVMATTFENFNFVSLGKLKDSIPDRTQRMAFARNRYLDEVKNTFSDFDYLVIADFNNLNKLITRDKILTSWKFDNWEVVTANQDGPYYDVWALRHKLWSPNNCWEAHAFYRKFIMDPEKALYATVNSRMLKIPKNSDWIQVDSAFGGLGIYKTKAVLGCRYSGIDEHGQPICEHVPLHNEITAKGGKIFINPALTNMKFTDHSRRSRYLSKIGRRFLYPYKAIRKLLLG